MREQRRQLRLFWCPYCSLGTKLPHYSRVSTFNFEPIIFSSVTTESHLGPWQTFISKKLYRRCLAKS